MKDGTKRISLASLLAENFRVLVSGPESVRLSFYEPVWRQNIIFGSGCVELLAGLDLAVKSDDRNALEIILNKMAANYGFKAAMQTKTEHRGLSQSMEMGISSKNVVESSVKRGAADWFSSAVQHKSIKCITWALENKWASPAQKVEFFDNLSSVNVASDEWNGEKATLRSLCWSNGGFSGLDWVSLAKNDERWFDFRDCCYSDHTDNVLYRALEAVVNPNSLMIDAIKDDKKDSSPILRRLKKKNQKRLLDFSELDEFGTAFETLSDDAYKDFVKMNICSVEDVRSFQLMLRSVEGLRKAHFSAEALCWSEVEVLKKSIGYSTQQAKPKNAAL